MTRRSPDRFLRRVGAMAWKETIHVLRDARSLYLAFGLPFVLVILFGFGVSFDLDHVPLVVVDRDGSPSSREVVRAMTATGEFEVALDLKDEAQVERAFRANRAVAALVIPWGFHQRLSRGQAARVQLLLDGSDGTSSLAILGSSTGLILDQARRLARASGASPGLPFEVRASLLYNPGLRSALFFVPALIAFVMAIAAVLLTALAVAREWERGNMEQLFATPVGRLEIILGKLAPYLAIGLLQALLVLVGGTTIFDVPVRGSLLTLEAATLLFLIGMLGQGLFISVITRNQQLATQLGAVTTILPTLILSGFLVPIDNMPLPLQLLSRIFPARYFMSILRGVMLKGVDASALWTDFIGLAIFAFVILALATLRFKREVA